MPSKRKGGIGSALARLIGLGRGAPEEGRAATAVQGPETLTKGPRTFQGRPVEKIMWEGEEVEAVQGLLAYRVREPGAAVAREEVERALDAPVLDASAPDELGIGVISTGQQVEAEAAVRAADRLRPDVLWTEPVLLDYGALQPNDTLFSQQWGLSHVNAPRAWELWNGDPNAVVLAILDSGISMQAGRLSHPDLIDEGRIFLGPDLVNNDAEPKDDHGHGTHVVGIAAATRNNTTGVAGMWPGSVLVVKVFNDVNLESSNVVFKDGVKAAVDFARRRGARLVINYSGGGPNTATKRAGVQHASDNGALLVAAAGNKQGGGIISPAFLSTQFSNVIAVGAVNRDRRRPGFASRGPQMSVVAPGVEILSTMPNYIVTLNGQRKETKFDLLEGTSQAAPFVAALAALVWSKSPHLTAGQVREKIVQTATPIAGSSNDFGRGLINAEAALS